MPRKKFCSPRNSFQVAPQKTPSTKLAPSPRIPGSTRELTFWRLGTPNTLCIVTCMVDFFFLLLLSSNPNISPTTRPYFTGFTRLRVCGCPERDAPPFRFPLPLPRKRRLFPLPRKRRATSGLSSPYGICAVGKTCDWLWY